MSIDFEDKTTLSYRLNSKTRKLGSINTGYQCRLDMTKMACFYLLFAIAIFTNCLTIRGHCDWANYGQWSEAAILPKRTTQNENQSKLHIIVNLHFVLQHEPNKPNLPDRSQDNCDLATEIGLRSYRSCCVLQASPAYYSWQICASEVQLNVDALVLMRW